MEQMTPPKTSAVFDAAYYEKARLAAEAIGRPLDEKTLTAIAKEAEAHAVFGFDAKKDRNGNWIPQGIGAPGNESLNHFFSIRRYEGEAKYQAAIRKMWKENPERAKLIGLELPERLS
jgi:hypothetical protein